MCSRTGTWLGASLNSCCSQFWVLLGSELLLQPYQFFCLVDALQISSDTIPPTRPQLLIFSNRVWWPSIQIYEPIALPFKPQHQWHFIDKPQNIQNYLITEKNSWLQVQGRNGMAWRISLVMKTSTEAYQVIHFNVYSFITYVVTLKHSKTRNSWITTTVFK